MAHPREHLLDDLHARLGYRRMNLVWAKAEIGLGLFALALGLALLVKTTGELYAALGIALFVLGGYLTLAGHRSHLYKAASERMALLVEEIRRTGTDTVVNTGPR